MEKIFTNTGGNAIMKYIDRLYEYEKEKGELLIMDAPEYEQKVKEIVQRWNI